MSNEKKVRENPVHVFQGTKISVGVRLKKGETKEKTAKFIFTKTENGAASELESIEVKISRKGDVVGKLSTGTAGVGAGEVSEKEDSYKLGYRLEIGKKKLEMGEEWVVWRDVVHLVAKKKIDGKLTTAGLIDVVLPNGETPKREQIAFAGERHVLVPKPGPFRFSLAAPVRFVDWLDGKSKGFEREFEYEIAPAKAVIASPPAGEGTLRRHVNTDGNAVDVHVKTMDLSGGSMVGEQTVHVECKFTNKTLRGKGKEPDADPDYFRERTLDGKQATFLLVKEKGKRGEEESTWKGEFVTDSNGEAHLTVYLGKGGGELCELKLGTTRTCEDAELTVETWRKLHLQYWHTDTDLTKDGWPVGYRKQTTDCYEKAHIEIEYQPDGVLAEATGLSEKDKVSIADWFEEDRSGWHAGRDFGLAPDRILLLNLGGDSWKRICGGILDTVHADKKGAYLNVVMADLAIDFHPYAGATSIKSQDLGMFLNQHQGAERLMVVKVGKDACPGQKEVHFGKIPDGETLKCRAWYRLYRDQQNKGARILLPEGSIVFEYDKKEKDNSGELFRGRMKILLPEDVQRQMAQEKSEKKIEEMTSLRFTGDVNQKAHAEEVLRDQLKVDVSWDVLLVNDISPAGISNGEFAIALVRTSGLEHFLLAVAGRKWKEINNTICHEVGHSIGMCCSVDQLSPTEGDFVNRAPDLTKYKHESANAFSYKEHPRWYVGRSHSGGHCAEGLSQSKYDGWKDLGGMGGYKCVIYGETQSFSTPAAYCENCLKIIGAMEVWTGKKPKGRR